jgi:hypothetical protein
MCYYQVSVPQKHIGLNMRIPILQGIIQRMLVPVIVMGEGVLKRNVLGVAGKLKRDQ